MKEPVIMSEVALVLFVASVGWLGFFAWLCMTAPELPWHD